jgi:hypothetical protein
MPDCPLQKVETKLKENPSSDWLAYRRAALHVLLDKERQKGGGS